MFRARPETLSMDRPMVLEEFIEVYTTLRSSGAGEESRAPDLPGLTVTPGGYRVANPITAPGALPRSRLSALYM
jgi:hypothetical protein